MLLAPDNRSAYVDWSQVCSWSVIVDELMVCTVVDVDASHCSLNVSLTPTAAAAAADDDDNDDIDDDNGDGGEASAAGASGDAGRRHVLAGDAPVCTCCLS